ncbi:YusW family protein [Oceanobacillus sp. Castelsardo]|uniref:YusW family protein n=1 Tax=Oceanobacillus sp. Castelsardo TaxID=1851204 RepID=UPI000838F717|nr:YusW family protein [Oceanobacillus sp. Castelsardo]
MRRILFLAAILIVTLTLVACGGGDNNNNDTNANQDTDTDVTNDAEQDTNEVDEQAGNDTNETTTDNNNEAGDMQAKMDELDYIDFELSVEYDGNKDYEASLEKNQNGNVEADLEDEINGVHINGQEAFDEIYPNVKKLTIKQDTSKEDAIQQALDAFSLETNYKEMELEIKFKDSTKIEFKDKK